jgi:uncharacterized membrane protein
MSRFEALVLARVVHVLGVVLWIGGVAFVTLALLPAVRDLAEPQRRIELFEEVERRFARQARWTTLLTGLSGFAMLWLLDAWGRYLEPRFWWIHAMTLVWLVFSLLLFVAEPLFLHAWFHRRAREAPDRTFATVLRLHRILLAVSLATLLGAVAGSHGWLIGAG